MRAFSLLLVPVCAVALAASSNGLLLVAAANRPAAFNADSPASAASFVNGRAPNRSASPRSAAPRRSISVSVLNDIHAPVRSELIDTLLRDVFASYKEALNIDFQAVETLPYDGDLTLFPMDQAFLLQRFHTRGEVRLIFSNYAGRDDESYMTDREAKNSLAGSSHPYFGHVIIYNAEGRCTRTDAAGHPALATALKHEIAHLFGVEHSNDTSSFMYTPSCRSQGEWTDDLIQRINERRGKHWFPNA